VTSSAPSSPYVGLRPFREQDFALFFGRDRETRIISSNLRARPLTVLYGSSGVGKSSVLQAGVVRRLKQEPQTTVLYFRDWQSETILKEILEQAYRFLPVPNKPALATNSQEGITSVNGQHAYLLLDQFEEYLLYHENDELGEEFDSTLSRIVNRKDCPVNVLVGIRDDSLFKLDRRFSLRIPNLLRDTLELERMTPDGARDAIQKPLATFSEMSGNGGTYSIGPDLVDEICKQVKAGSVVISDSAGVGAKYDSGKEGRIETAYLQLVLTTLWEAERNANSNVLRLQTLQKLGGADSIVRHHVNAVMNELANDREREIACNMLCYLVTPSRTKIAQTTADLVSFAERREPEVKAVLDKLTNRSESRILRKLSDPEQYEIFHDVLAQPLLDWRRERDAVKERNRLLRYIALAAAVAALFGVLGLYAERERRVAQAASKRAAAAFAEANQTADKLALISGAERTAIMTLRQAEEKGKGNESQVAALKAQLLQYSNQAQTVSKNYEAQQQSIDASSKLAAQDLQRTTYEKDTAIRNLSVAQKERDDYKAKLETANQRIQELENAAKPPVQSPAPQKQAQTAGDSAYNSGSQPPAPSMVTAQVGGGSSWTRLTHNTIPAGTELCGKLSQTEPVPTMKISYPSWLSDASFQFNVEGGWLATRNGILQNAPGGRAINISAEITSYATREKHTLSLKGISGLCITVTKDVSLAAPSK